MTNNRTRPRRSRLVPRRGLARHFLAAACWMLLPAVLVAAVAVTFLARDERQVEAGLHELESEHAGLTDLREELGEIEAPALSVLWAGRNASGQEYESLRAAIDDRFAALEGVSESPDEEANLQVARGIWEQAVDYLDEVALDVGNPAPADALVLSRQENYRALLGAAITQVEATGDDAAEEATAAFTALDRSHDLAFVLILALLVGGLTLAVVAASHLSRRVIGRLRRLQSGALHLARGDLGHRVALDDEDIDDEIGELAATLDTMAARLEHASSELVHRALHDPLTGLGNRALLHDRLEHALRRQRRQEQSVAVILIDLDRFKHVNDGLGHDAGDELIRLVGERIATSVSSGDTVARIGGDEFAVLVEDLPRDEDAERIAERIAQALAGEVAVGGAPIALSTSIGVALLSDCELRDDERGDELLKCADIAMYAAKTDGRGGIRRFEASMRVDALERLTLERELRRAVTRREFTVHYQPIVDVRDGVAVALEALARWEHPVRGTLPPAAFLDVAEDTALIAPIGWQVLEQACVDGVERLPGHLRIHVNVAAEQLEQAGTLANVREILERTGFPADRVVLEITESKILDSGKGVALRLHQLRRLGVHLAIDDFGTGYASLASLQLPIDVLKIDKRFVDDLAEGDDEPSAVVRAVVDVARALHLDTIAEGVEHDRQAAALERLGSPIVQGFLFARPMPLDQVEEFLREHAPRGVTASGAVLA